MDNLVVPAQAGMSLSAADLGVHPYGSPRAGGDEPSDQKIPLPRSV